jgi:hypothetical protein
MSNIDMKKLGEFIFDGAKNYEQYLMEKLHQPKLVKIFGCGAPEHSYFHNEALYAVYDNGHILLAFFDQYDYIGHMYDFEEVKKNYKEYIDKGWKPLEKEEILKYIPDTNIDDAFTKLIL